MYAGRVACCPLVNHVEYAPRALLRLEKDGTDGQTDGWIVARRYITLTAKSSQRNEPVSRYNQNVIFQRYMLR